MKKLFRFKYEPCNGTCYAHQPIFFSEMKKLTPLEKETLVAVIVKAHDQMCDNPDYYFGVDFCEDTNVFIGHFTQPNRCDLYTANTLAECVSKMCKDVINTTIPIYKGLCNFGTSGNENLADQILACC